MSNWPLQSCTITCVHARGVRVRDDGIEAEDALLAFLPTLHHHSIAAELAS